MALTEFDQNLLQRGLEHDQEAWKEFVDRFLSVFYHVICHTANVRSILIEKEEIEDLCADIISHIITDDYKVLRKFRGKASLVSYLAVVARRVTVHYLLRRTAIEQRRTEKQREPIPAPQAAVLLATTRSSPPIPSAQAHPIDHLQQEKNRHRPLTNQTANQSKPIRKCPLVFLESSLPLI